ncbi:hypothetical protein CYMTET_24264 [Cymbomonas tetramitiformis]|uniref:Tify domain-containing protein n=1 Tax=Cymbomonas tetramitiformis TaxID=36881 RepID=A0AAE0L079_9CHLO|nr:hypothetical protein CYMTET_24264 [Cymbomonas tetramitiformis]|eukprot:gene3831-4786_t
MPGKQPLTICYKGIVHEFSDFPANEFEQLLRKARELAAASATTRISGTQFSILPSEVGVLILNSLDLGQILRFSCASNVTYKWVNVCLPHLTRLRFKETYQEVPRTWLGHWMAPGLCLLNVSNVRRLELVAVRANSTCNDLALSSSIDVHPFERLHLEYFDAAGCQSVNDQVIERIASDSPHLQHLNLLSCQNVTGHSIREIGQSCPELRHLALGLQNESETFVDDCFYRTINDATISDIARGCRKLEHLDLGYCNVTDMAVVAIAQCCDNLNFCRISACGGVTGTSILVVAERCPNLQHLDISLCEEVSDAAIQEVALRCSNLQHVDISGCQHTTDATVQLLAQRCPKLLHVNVSGCEKVCDISIQEVAQRLPNLQHLGVSSCHQVTNASIVVVAERCPNLQHLDVSGCDEVTDASIQVVAKLSNLQYLDVSGCEQVEEDHGLGDRIVKLEGWGDVGDGDYTFM